MVCPDIPYLAQSLRAAAEWQRRAEAALDAQPHAVAGGSSGEEKAVKALEDLHVQGDAVTVMVPVRPHVAACGCGGGARATRLSLARAAKEKESAAKNATGLRELQKLKEEGTALGLEGDGDDDGGDGGGGDGGGDGAAAPAAEAPAAAAERPASRQSGKGGKKTPPPDAAAAAAESAEAEGEKKTQKWAPVDGDRERAERDEAMREWRALDSVVSKAAAWQVEAEAALTKKETVEELERLIREGDLLAIPMDEFGWLQANLAEAREWLEQAEGSPRRLTARLDEVQRLVKEYAKLNVESLKIEPLRERARGRGVAHRRHRALQRLWDRARLAAAGAQVGRRGAVLRLPPARRPDAPDDGMRRVRRLVMSTVAECRRRRPS